RAYDMRRLVARMVDGGLLFELKHRFGRAIITALTRIGGGVGGVVANQAMYKAGGCDADGCDKVISFLCLCDSFNVPLLFLHDIPGFFIGKEAERRGVPGKIINWMEALGQVTVPRISIVVRKTYGQAYFNMGGGDYSDLLLAWPTADMSFMDPDTGVNVVHGAAPAALDPAERSARRKELLEQWEWDTLPYGAAARHLVHEVIAPAHSRAVPIRFLGAWESRGGHGASTSPTGAGQTSGGTLPHDVVRHPPRREEIGHPHEHDQRAARQRAVDAGADGGGRGRNDPGDQKIGALDQDADDQEGDHHAGKDSPLGEEEIEEDESPEEQDGIGHQLAHDEGTEERVIGAASRRGHRVPGRGIEGAKPANDLRNEANGSEAEAEGDQVEPPADAARRAVISQFRHAHLLAFPTQAAASLAGRRAIDKATAARRACRPCAPWISPSRSSR